MKLNLNFDGFTKLRDWWKTVLSNFEIIQTECNKTRQIADNACTKEEAKAYINEFIGLSDEYMAAIEAFTDLYKENGNSVAAMEEVFGERLKYYSKEEVFDANEATGEDAIFFCKAETENTPSNQTGILISKTDNKQMWIEENGEIYYRQLVDDAWGEWVSELNKWQTNLIKNVGETLQQNVKYVDGFIDYLNKSPMTLRRDDNGNLSFYSNNYSQSLEIDFAMSANKTYESSGEYFAPSTPFTHVMPPYEEPTFYSGPIVVSLDIGSDYTSNTACTLELSNMVLCVRNSTGDNILTFNVEDNITISLPGESYKNSWSFEIDWQELPPDKYSLILQYDIKYTNANIDMSSYRDANLVFSTSESYNIRDIIEYPNTSSI